jgi:hypothetical protein
MLAEHIHNSHAVFRGQLLEIQISCMLILDMFFISSMSKDSTKISSLSLSLIYTQSWQKQALVLTLWHESIIFYQDMFGDVARDP